MSKRIAGLAAIFCCATVSGADLGDAVSKDYDEHLAGLFDHFHRSPELSTVENETARRMAEELRAAAVSGYGSSSSDAESTDAVIRMRDALTKLPSEQRAMVSLHYLDGMGVAEIARALDVPEGTVKSRLYHARSRLKQVLERMET